jgi:hypothetical protein
MKGIILCDVTPCALVEVYKCFGETYCSRHQSRSVELFACFMLITCSTYSSTLCHITDNDNLQEKALLYYRMVSVVFTSLIVLYRPRNYISDAFRLDVFNEKQNEDNACIYSELALSTVGCCCCCCCCCCFNSLTK